MQTDFCKKVGIDLPIFAFTHCRDVVVAEWLEKDPMGLLGWNEAISTLRK